MMSRRRTKSSAAKGLPLPLPTQTTTAAAGGVGGAASGTAADGNCEMRPGGMLVQTRSDSDQNRPPPPTIRVRVKYCSVYHEISISSQASFGELKKMLTGPTGLHHEDQKLIFKDKERDSKAFLDTTGVKNKSKIVLIKDSISEEKRYLEMRKAAKLEKAAKSISDISLEVDKLAGQVAALESVISKGGKVTENYVVNLIELLMNQLLKLDEIIEAVDAKVQMQGKLQVKRVQNYVETLDMLKIKNSMPNADGNVQSPVQKQQDQHPFGIAPNQQPQKPPLQLDRQAVGLLKRPQQHQQHQQQQQTSRLSYEIRSPVQQPFEEMLQPSTPSSASSSSGPVVITTQWETFDSFPAHPSAASTASTSVPNGLTKPAFTWDLI